jgi:hypothetical protein
MHSAHGTRLLSIGEIFDRAVHLTVANLLPLAAIVGLVAVPTRAVADWMDRDALSRSFGAEGKIVVDPRLLVNYFTLIRDPHAHSFNWPALLWVVASLLPLSLAVAAASIASQAFLNGERPELGAAYRSAIRRLAPVIGASMLVWAAYLAGIVAVFIAVSILWIAWVAILTIVGGTVTSSQIVVLTAVLGLAVVAAFAWLAPLGNCTFAGAALHMTRPFRALREAWTMTMSRGLRGRSLALGAAVLALAVAQQFIRLTLCGFLSDVTHWLWLSFVASDAITLLSLIFGIAIAVVFYLDARNRVGLLQDPLANRENSGSQ